MSGYCGQKKFKAIVENDFVRAYVNTQSAASFQDSWKALTGMPQKGNHNPNYKDCLVYIEGVLERGLDARALCPLLPVERRVTDRRKDYDDETYWHLMYELCAIYKDFVGSHIKCAKKVVDALYNNGFIKPFDNNYEYLRNLGCNLSLDILAAKAAQ